MSGEGYEHRRGPLRSLAHTGPGGYACVMRSLVLAVLSLAAASPLQTEGQKAEAQAKKAIRKAAEAAQPAAKKFDKSVHDAAKALKKSLSDK